MSIRVGGFGYYRFEVFKPHIYEINDIVYSKHKARKGIFEKICIKDIRYISPKLDNFCRICNYPPMYIDTLNAYHNEQDLIVFNEAAELVYQYKINRAIALEEIALGN